MPQTFTLWLAAAFIVAARADIITVLANDSSRIVYSGSGWLTGDFEIRGTDLDPPGGGPNSTVCEIGDPGPATKVAGDSFSFSFTGVSIQLVIETRADHGLYNLDFNGVTSLLDGYSFAPHCGVAFTSPQIALGNYSLVATLIAVSPGSPWPDFYLQPLKFIYDTGVNSSATSSTGSATSTTQIGPTSTGSGTSDNTSIAGGSTSSVQTSTIALAVALPVGAILVSVLAFLLWRQCRQPQPIYEPNIRDADGVQPGPHNLDRAYIVTPLDISTYRSESRTATESVSTPNAHLPTHEVDRIAVRVADIIQRRQGLTISPSAASAIPILPVDEKGSPPPY